MLQIKYEQRIKTSSGLQVLTVLPPTHPSSGSWCTEDVLHVKANREEGGKQGKPGGGDARGAGDAEFWL